MLILWLIRSWERDLTKTEDIRSSCLIDRAFNDPHCKRTGFDEGGEEEEDDDEDEEEGLSSRSLYMSIRTWD